MAFTNQTKTSASSWLGVTGSNLVTTDLGDSPNFLSNMLTGNGNFSYIASTPQEFTLDLGANYTVNRVRSRSNIVFDVTGFDVYVSETNGNWGTAVATSINPSATSTYVETNTTSKVGRYVRVVINSVVFPGLIAWGIGGAGNCFDVGTLSQFSNQTKNTGNYGNQDKTLTGIVTGGAVIGLLLSLTVGGSSGSPPSWSNQTKN